MAKGTLYLKRSNAWVDAKQTYGIALESEGMSRLLTPAPHKEPVQNRNMAMHGTSIVGGTQYKDVRTVSLPMHIYASSESDFLDKYDAFCADILDTGWVHMKVVRTTRTLFFHFRYVDCQPFSEYNMEMAIFTLSLEEPNPNNRTE